MQAINYQAKGVNYPSLEETGPWCSSGLRVLFPIERTLSGIAGDGTRGEEERDED